MLDTTYPLVGSMLHTCTRFTRHKAQQLLTKMNIYILKVLIKCPFISCFCLQHFCDPRPACCTVPWHTSVVIFFLQSYYLCTCSWTAAARPVLWRTWLKTPVLRETCWQRSSLRYEDPACTLTWSGAASQTHGGARHEGDPTDASLRQRETSTVENRKEGR